MKSKSILISLAIIYIFFNFFQINVLSAPNIGSNLQKKNNFLKRTINIEKELNYRFKKATSQIEMNWVSNEIFGELNDLLNNIYQYLKETLSASNFETLKSNQIDWVKQRNEKIKKAGLEVEGGTIRPLKENNIGISITSERIYYLISLIPIEHTSDKVFKYCLIICNLVTYSYCLH